MSKKLHVHGKICSCLSAPVSLSSVQIRAPSCFHGGKVQLLARFKFHAHEFLFSRVLIFTPVHPDFVKVLLISTQYNVSLSAIPWISFK